MSTPINILHVEDNESDMELVRHELRQAGLDVKIQPAKARAEFLNALESGPYDVVLSDNRVPGLDGGAALQLVRERWPEVPFIFVSGSAASGREPFTNPKVTGCVDKSHLDRLPATIRKATGQSSAPETSRPSDWYVHAVEELVEVVQKLSLARDLNRIMEIVRHAARSLTGADGATFVLRDGDNCYYADEEAIAPLWKGNRFPMSICISGWVMLNRQSTVIEDIYADARIPADAYRPTFVKSLAMVPIRSADPVGAIGTYWASKRQPRPEEVKLLQALADSTSVAMENAQLYAGLEQKVADRTVRLQALNEDLEAFSYSVSHDLRAPLRHIGAFARLLEDEVDGRLSSKGRSHLNSITNSARRMSLLIDDLLEFSRMGRLELNRARVDMNELVDEVRSELEPDTKDRVIQWFIEELPTVEGDRALIKQVWVNLLSNAVKFTRERNPAEIRIAAVDWGKEVEFSVRDNGAGFDMEGAPKLFGVFERMHSADQFEGTGIGLANVRRIVTRHGGITWAEAKVDHGASLYFTLPSNSAHK